MASLRIAVLGAGKIGGTLGRKWLAAGHEVAFGVRDPEGERAGAVRADVGDRAAVTSVAEALESAGVVLFAIPGRAAAATAAQNGPALQGKIVIDATNNMGATTVNSVAAIQSAAPDSQVYRAFNIYGWENFEDPLYGGTVGDLFYAGPDGEPQAIVEQLIVDTGLRPIRVGGSEQAAIVDGLMAVWFALIRGGRGRHLAFKLLSP
jgi:predicted dinucleotide-binding enzyme